MEILDCERKCQTLCTCLLVVFYSALLAYGAKGFSDLQFQVEPSDFIVIKDSPALLNCSATGNPPPNIQWKKDGKLLDFDNRRIILANGSLYFQKVLHSRSERLDDGYYQCTASIPEIGTIVSRAAKLQIASLPPFDKYPQDVAVFLHQTVYFPCSIQAMPAARITWFKNEQPLILDETRMTILPSGALEIDSVASLDEGAYHCVAMNAEKSRKSDVGFLILNKNIAAANLLSPPKFVATPPNTTVILKGGNLTLDCAANGYPKPTIIWLKDGETIDLAHLDSRLHIIGSGSLSVENVIENDAGTYMCRAQNSEDSADTSVTVDILVPPYFIQKPVSKFAHEKEDIEFKCEVYGNPMPILEWFKNGDVIIPNEYLQIIHGRNLRILGLVESDSGIYQCFATNSAGSIQSSAQLVVIKTVSSDSTTLPPVTPQLYLKTPGQLQYHKDAPSEPLNVTAAVVATRFIALSWQPPYERNGEIVAYSVYFREESSTRERVINTTGVEEVNVQGLLPATKYVFRVVAYNQNGPGKSSSELTVTTDPDVLVPYSPSSIMAIPLSSTSILVRWKPPDIIKEPIVNYKLYYTESESPEEHEFLINTTSYEIRNLKKYTNYTFWVAALNRNGVGSNTEEVTVRTYADVPSETPQNVTLEAASSTSIIVRWEPPPKRYQNGIITGYKIRYKQRNGKRGETLTTDGSRRFYSLTELEKGAQYLVKIAALSVNGSGPYTDWKSAETHLNDLYENKVPDMPSVLRARPSSNSIFVSWGPPKDQTITVRGYTIGWGIGLPDVYTKNLDETHRYFDIPNLQPSSEYVISLRAFNQVGSGRAVYETVKTEVETTPEPLTPMLPPVGLKAYVLSSATVVLYWTDTTLSRNQLITDSRFYTVRYTTYTYSSSPKYRYFNSTDLNCMIDDLKPNTQYEFSVKVVKGRRESKWSMSVINTTQEAAPSSPPRDLTVVASEDDASQINLHWQPPKQPNGHITGYVIFYTTDKTQRDRDWVVEGVVGDKMTTVLKGLTLDTTYYFKIQARNNKGYGPLSSEIAFHTAPGLALASGSALFDNKGIANSFLYIIIACAVGVMVLVILVSIVICRRRNRYIGADNSYKSSKLSQSKNKNASKDLVPPDLWIHHDQMELKSLDKSSNSESNMTVTPIQRNSQELCHEPLLNTLEKKKSAYLDSINDELLSSSDKCIVKCRPIRATPIKISLDHQKPVGKESSVVTSTSNLNQCSYEMGTNSLGRPLYPRTQYNIHRTPTAHDAHQAVTLGDPPPPPPITVIPHCPGSSYDVSGSAVLDTSRSVAFVPTVHENSDAGSSNTLTKKHTGHQHSLRSFTVPATPSQSVPATPLSKHVSVKSPHVISSPHKKVTLHTPDESGNEGLEQSAKVHPGISSLAKSSSTSTSSKPANIQPSESTEHLNQEMANLEGLMKDLNAITASEFEC